MTEPTRPEDVSEGAVCIMPGLTQPGTIASIEHTTAAENLQAYAKWFRGLQDWKVNAQAAQNAGQDIPPIPKRDPTYLIQITYADVAGEVVTDALGEKTHSFYAWIETVEQ